MILFLAVITALLSVLLGAVCWTLYALLRQNGRLIIRLESVEAALAALKSSDGSSERVFADRSLARSRIDRAGLAAGTLAPDFRLPTLDGREAGLSEYTGRWLVLVFSDPDCKPCMALLPRLERAARASKMSVLLVSRGEAEANRNKVKEAGVTLRVALQRHWEVSRLYAMFATPIAYLIDPQGRIADNVAVGADAILALFSKAAYLRTGSGESESSRRTLVH